MRRFAAIFPLALAALTSPVAAQPAREPPSGGADPGKPADAPLEVTVHGDPSSQPGQPPPREARLVPGAFGDPIRAIETLPGVAPTASGLPYFYLRGAPPANSGYFIDGIPVPLLFHIGPGSSIVSPGLVDRVDFYPGSPPARYGGFLGGVVAAETTAPFGERRVELAARTFEANALVETPIGADTSVLVAGRYGYPNLLLSAIGSTVSLAYFDYSLRVARRLSARETLSLLAFGADDRLHDDLLDSDLFTAGVHRVDLRYDRRLDQGSLRVAATIGYDRTGQGAPGQPVNDEINTLGPRIRLEWKKRVEPWLALSAGAALSGQQAHYNYSSVLGQSLSVVPHMDATAGAFVDASLRVAPRLEVSPGVRFDVYKASDTTLGAVDPRIGLRYEASPALAFKAAASVAHQLPTYIVPAPGLDFDVQNGLQRASQLSLGSELSLPSRLFISLTGFVTALSNGTDYVTSCGQREFCSLVGRVSGRTYGVEILAKRPLSKRLSGWIAYTLSRAERTHDGQEYLSPFDRTQVFSGVLSYNFGFGYRAGIRATYYSGRPELPALFQGTSQTPFTFLQGEVAQHRLPDFYRVDWRADKTWFVGSSGARVTAVLEFFNATLSKEAYNWQCDFSGNCVAKIVGPIALPSLGIEGAL